MESQGPPPDVNVGNARGPKPCDRVGAALRFTGFNRGRLALVSLP